MGKHIIQRIDDGKYVAPAGSTRSYTWEPTRARVFPTKEAAQQDCCGNERPVAVADLFR